MKHLTRTLSICLLFALGVTGATAQDALQEQRFLMTFIPNIQFSPLYVGMEQGYFADAGFKLSVEYLNEPDVVDLVAAGQANYGVVSGEQVILSRAQAREVVYVYEWFQQYPVGVVVAADNGITDITGLKGKKVGLPGRFGANYSGFTALILNAGMSETDVQLEEIGFNAPDVFCLGGTIDAAVVYINNEPLQIRARAAKGECGSITDVTVIPVAANADLVSNGLITSESLAASNPDEVRAIVAAFDKGLRDVINNPARAYLISLNYVENLPISDDFRVALEDEAEAQDAFLESAPDRASIAGSRAEMFQRFSEQFDSDTLIQLEVLLASIDLWDAEALGHSDLASWQNMQDTLLAMGMVQESIVLESAFTNDFLPVE